jgi:hypothetical protein
VSSYTLEERIKDGRIYHQVRIQAAKSLRNVAVETPRQVGRHDIGRLLRRNLTTLNGEALRSLQRRSVFQPVDLPDGLAAVDALLVPVPIPQDIANQTFFGRKLDLHLDSPGHSPEALASERVSAPRKSQSMPRDPRPLPPRLAYAEFQVGSEGLHGDDMPAVRTASVVMA